MNRNTNLGLRLGLPMPRVEVIDVSGWLIENTDDLRVEFAGASIPCSSGRQLASLYAGDVIEASICDYLPDDELKHVVNIQDFAPVLVLDKWTCNTDGRQAIFKCQASRSRRYSAVFIDQGFCFNADEWNFPDAPLRGAYARQRVYENVTLGIVRAGSHAGRANGPWRTLAIRCPRAGGMVRTRCGWNESPGRDVISTTP
jgi:hypothetical protein